MIGLKGTRRWMEVRAVPLRDEPSGATLVLAITRDITARKRAETQLRESEARFRASPSCPPTGTGSRTPSTASRGSRAATSPARTATSPRG